MRLKNLLSVLWNAYSVVTLLLLSFFYGKYLLSFIASIFMPPLLLGSFIVQTIYVINNQKRGLINYLILIISLSLLVSLTTGYLTSLNTIIILLSSAALFNTQHYLTNW